MSALVTHFGIVVRQMRVARGWSQSQLAARADLDRSFVGEIERGDVVASLVTLEKLAAAFETDAAQVIDRCSRAIDDRSVRHARLTAIAR